jgi:carboxylesterase
MQVARNVRVSAWVNSPPIFFTTFISLQQYYPFVTTYLENGEPFIFNNPRAPAAVVCVHGLSATPYEVRPIGEALYKAGFHVEGLVVYGHALAPIEDGIAAFQRSTWQQWLDSIRAVVMRLKQQFPKVFIMGQSMGGVIAFRLAEEGIPDAIATTGAALHLPRAVELFNFIIKHMNRIIHKKAQPRSFTNVSYNVLSSKAGAQLHELNRKTRRMLGVIKCSVLAIHSMKDDTVPPVKVTRLLQKHVIAPLEIAWFNESCHTMPLDIEGPEIARKIVDFFLRMIK